MGSVTRLPYTIQHSGCSFTSVGYAEWFDAYIWPIEEYLVRTKHGRNVAARIRRMNPDGKPEGAHPRGWHPSTLYALEGKRRKTRRRDRYPWARRCKGSA